MNKRHLILRHARLLLCAAMLVFFIGCAAAPASLQPGTCFTTSECLYMNPLNAVFWDQGDNGYRYCIEETAFTWHLRENSASGIGQIENVSWGWQDFPYTDVQWNAMLETSDLFNHAAIENINARYDHPLYQPLDADLFLLRLDDEIWLVNMMPSGPEENPWQIISIYTLEPEI